MVRVDDVYQKVLALASKEQRGYITPQEFNLFADHAQMNIFEQYFYDLSQRQRIPGNDQEYADLASAFKYHKYPEAPVSLVISTKPILDASEPDTS